ncbi:MAG: DHH family phosphoesterase [Porphyromonadaceae bacterium]|nr:DHH family phosphoesterase [Porphyromonadaceae bacterium]
MNEINSLTEINLPQQALDSFRDLVATSRRIVILPHTAPDGDALGSTIAFGNVLQSLHPDKNICVISPDPVEQYLSWMPEVDTLLHYATSGDEAIAAIAEADLLIHMDHNQRSRLRYQPLVDAAISSRAPSVLIDHHLYPEAGFTVCFSYPGISSTCELTLRIVQALGWQAHVSPTSSTLLLTGIVTDTGRFMYGCFAPDLYHRVSDLLGLGADYGYIIDRLSYHGRIEQLRAQGYVLHEKLELYPELRAACFVLTQEEMQHLGVSKGDTEGLVNLPLSVEGVDCSCFIREDRGQIKLSFRSTGDFPVNEIASRGFSGGGHLNAAGAEHYGSIEEAKNIYLYQLKCLIEERKKSQASN